MQRLTDYGTNIIQNVTAGRGVVLFGPPGTGKDHLMAGLMVAAIREGGFAVNWQNGMDLFGRVRDAMDTDTRERDIIRDFTAPDVLVISDPVPPWGDLTQFQAAFLFRVIDARYRQKVPTWVTANFTNGDEAGGRLGTQVLDRLKDGALSIYCNWESYRKATNT